MGIAFVLSQGKEAGEPKQKKGKSLLDDDDDDDAVEGDDEEVEEVTGDFLNRRP